MEKSFLDNESIREYELILSLLKKSEVEQSFKDVNFSSLINLTLEHRVFLLLYNDLEKFYAKDYDKLMYLKEIKKELINSILLNISALLEITNLLINNEINFLVLKGVILSDILYQNFFNRESIDIDILVYSEKDALKFINLLKSKNYNVLDKKIFKNKLYSYLYFKAKNSIKLFSKSKKSSIDLHFRLFGNRIFTANKFKAFTSNVELYKFYTHEVSILSHEYYFLLLCVHSSIHCFKRLVWIYDVYQYINRYNIDLLRIYKIACDYKLEKHFINAIYVCDRLFNISDKTKPFNIKEYKITRIVINRLPYFLNDEDNFRSKMFRFFYKVKLAGSLLEKIDILLSYILRVFLRLFK